MQHSKAYRWLKTILNALIEMAPNWLKAISKLIFSLAGQKEKPDKETQPKQYLKNIPATITTFTGRENDLSELHNLLEEKRTVLLLNGLGGIGKTTAAQEYAKRNDDYYDSIIWLDYEDSFKSSFIKLNEFLCVDCKPEVVYQHIISELAGYTGNLLLIIDNFNNDKDSTVLQQLLPNFKKLITSREEIPFDFVITKF